MHITDLESHEQRAFRPVGMPTRAARVQTSTKEKPTEETHTISLHRQFAVILVSDRYSRVI